jgi:hypothetical protein
MLLSKLYMQRRGYATMRKSWPGPDVVCASESLSFDDYLKSIGDDKLVIDMLVGDLQRVIDYPARGFAIAQDVPGSVMDAYRRLTAAGYDSRLMEGMSRRGRRRPRPAGAVAGHARILRTACRRHRAHDHRDDAARGLAGRDPPQQRSAGAVVGTAGTAGRPRQRGRRHNVPVRHQGQPQPGPRALQTRQLRIVMFNPPRHPDGVTGDDVNRLTGLSDLAEVGPLALAAELGEHARAWRETRASDHALDDDAPAGEVRF